MLIIIVSVILSLGGVVIWLNSNKSNQNESLPTPNPTIAPTENPTSSPSATPKSATKSAQPKPTASPKPTATPSTTPTPTPSSSPNATPAPVSGVYQLDLSSEGGVQSHPEFKVPLGQSYSFAARLTDSNGATIKDQSDISFEWKLNDTVHNHDDYTCYGSLKIQGTNDLRGEIASPVPNNYGYFWAHNAKPVPSCPENLMGGRSTISVKAIKKSSGQTIGDGQITMVIGS